MTPEATPNPRSIRFVTGPIHDGPSRWYESAEQADDARAARLFADFDEVTNVLVGPDFVAVGLRHPDGWETLLEPVLRTVTEEFATGDRDSPSVAIADTARAAPAGPTAPNTTDPERTSRARSSGRGASSARCAPRTPPISRGSSRRRNRSNGAYRQVAARLLLGADPDAAAPGGSG